jgi:hypothetical protein
MTDGSRLNAPSQTHGPERDREPDRLGGEHGDQRPHPCDPKRAIGIARADIGADEDAGRSANSIRQRHQHEFEAGAGPVAGERGDAMRSDEAGDRGERDVRACTDQRRHAAHAQDLPDWPQAQHWRPCSGSEDTPMAPEIGDESEATCGVVGQDANGSAGHPEARDRTKAED